MHGYYCYWGKQWEHSQNSSSSGKLFSSANSENEPAIRLTTIQLLSESKNNWHMVQISALTLYESNILVISYDKNVIQNRGKIFNSLFLFVV